MLGGHQQQGGKAGLHCPDVEPGGQGGEPDQLPAGGLLLGDGLFEEAGAPLLAVEGAQYRLSLGKLHHALAGIGGMLVEGLVGLLVEAGGEQEDRHQQR